MTHLIITICLDNAAFHDQEGSPDHGPEVAKILRKLADSIQDSPEIYNVPLRDSNGNTVGGIAFKNPGTPAWLDQALNEGDGTYKP
jgi:hypothetical protein